MKVLRVLLVDDNIQLTELMCEYLIMLGHEVVIAHDVQTALERFEKSFDLLISDYDMPDGTGFDLISHIPADSNIKKILISGQIFSIPDFVKRYFDVCLAKPFFANNLESAIDNLFL